MKARKPERTRLYASIAERLVRRGLPAVLAMQYAITDVAAIEFTRSFYGALANGLPVDAASAEARKAMSLAAPDSWEWATPVLFLRSADGELWTRMQQAEGDKMDSEKAQPWWEQVANAIGAIDASQARGTSSSPSWAPAPRTWPRARTSPRR